MRSGNRRGRGSVPAFPRLGRSLALVRGRVVLDRRSSLAASAHSVLRGWGGWGPAGRHGRPVPPPGAPAPGCGASPWGFGGRVRSRLRPRSPGANGTGMRPGGRQHSLCIGASLALPADRTTSRGPSIRGVRQPRPRGEGRDEPQGPEVSLEPGSRRGGGPLQTRATSRVAPMRTDATITCVHAIPAINPPEPPEFI